MNQIEREYKNALDEVRFSRGEKERMMNDLMERTEQAPAGRHSFRPLRAGLIAACLCLALVGTAFAAGTVYQLVAAQIIAWEDEGGRYTGYQITGEPVLHPMEDFTQELQDDFAAWDHPSILFNRDLDTWEEAKAYLGDKIPAVWHSMDDIIWTSGYRVSALYDMYGDGKVKYVNVYNEAQLSNRMAYTTDIYIYTPDYTSEVLDALGWAQDGSVDFRVLDSYTMANGCVAQVVEQTIDHEEGAVHDYFSVFMKEGILYRVKLYGWVQCPLDEAGMEAQLHQILDSFA